MLSEIAAGVTLASLSVPVCVAAGVLVFGSFGAGYIGQGAVAGLFCAATAGIAGASFRRSSFLATIPTTPIALIQASTVVALLGAVGNPAHVIAVLPVMVLLVGLWQLLFGLTGLSRVIKFTPYPVLAGFVTGIALLMALAQLPTMFGVPSLRALGAGMLAMQLPSFSIPAFGFAVTTIIALCGRFAPRLPNLLIGLALGVVLYHALRWIAPGLEVGPTVGAVSIPSLSSFLPTDVDGLRPALTNFKAIEIVLLGSLTLALLGTLDTFFGLRAAQNLADIKVSPRRDIMGQGLANAFAALSGGLAVSISLALSNANYRAGGRTRISTIVAALILLAGTLAFPGAISSLPLVVLAAILLISAVRLMDRWTFRILRDALVAREKSDRTRSRLNALVVVAVLAATVFGQPVIGAAVGFALSCLIFIAQMSRPVIAQTWSGEGLRSKRVRSRHHGDILRLQGGRIAVLQLQGVLFFGNADDLAAALRSLPETSEIVILDMRRVTDIDTSGATVLQDVAQRFHRAKRQLVLCGVDQKLSGMVAPVVVASAMLITDRDTALEWAEEKLIHAHPAEHSLLEFALGEADLAQQMTPEEIATFEQHVQVVSYQPGETLCRAGDPADRMWIIRRGSVSVRVATSHGQRRLASLGPGCSVGEMGLIDQRPRSADVVADEQVEAYLMLADNFAAILRDYPRVGQGILANIARQLSQRLRDTSEELRVADR